MTEFVWRVGPLAAEAAYLFAQVLAFKLRTGDCVALSGDVGAGKTTLARSIIRAITAEPGLDVASPTYALMQSYESARANIQHYDFYRLGQADDVLEIGFEDSVTDCITLVEWPERAEEVLPAARLAIDIQEVALEGAEEARIYQMTASGDGALRLRRVQEIWQFLVDWLDDHAAAGEVTFSYLQGDASARAYALLHRGETSWILMDSPRQPDGPPIRDGKSYSQLAHLAEDVCPFVAIAQELGKNGFSVPKIDAVDFDNGFAVVENLGVGVFGNLIEAGHDKIELYRAATEVLVELAQLRVPEVLTVDGHSHLVPTYGQSVLLIETELLLDWYFQWSAGEGLGVDKRQEFLALWTEQLQRLDSLPKGWALR
ncbi:MAG: tRNA (adenosine(37)-N6)-threonylcarbamoyltransferase complex ATPase subunit type 1 TsaE, partial [Pseudomonadota bacterium]